MQPLQTVGYCWKKSIRPQCYKIDSYSFKLSNFRFSGLSKHRHPRAIIDPWRVTEIWFVPKSLWYMYAEQAKMCEFRWAKHFLQWLPQWNLVRHSLAVHEMMTCRCQLHHASSRQQGRRNSLMKKRLGRIQKYLMNQTCVVGYLLGACLEGGRHGGAPAPLKMCLDVDFKM